MSQYKAYPAYKDSGVEWIGQVPEEWKTGKLKHLGTLKGGSGFPTDMQGQPDNELPFYKVGDLSKSRDNISLNGSSNTISRKDAKELGATVFPENTISWAKIGAALFLNRRRISKTACCLDNNMTGFVVDSKKVPIQYAFYLMNAIDFSFFARPGAVPSLSEGEQSAIPIAIPSYEESFSIAATLERETARIDALIQKKTRFIELLKEKRQALITHAVTKGLDPKVKMKDSGVEWIGKVPEHWDVKPFFALVTELNRKNVGLVETNILSLSYGNIIQKPETRNMGLTPESYETYQIVESGEIVFRFTDLQNDKRSLRSAQVTQRGIITSAYMAVKPRSIDSTYFAWLMRSYDLCKVFYAMGGGLRQSLKFEDVRRLPVLIPPVDEQSEITNIINAGTARIDALVEKTEQSITLLKERRAAFITAAVTGQIDLRGEQ